MITEAKVNIVNLGLKKEQRLVIRVLFIAITFCFTLESSFNFSANRNKEKIVF